MAATPFRTGVTLRSCSHHHTAPILSLSLPSPSRPPPSQISTSLFLLNLPPPLVIAPCSGVAVAPTIPGLSLPSSSRSLPPLSSSTTPHSKPQNSIGAPNTILAAPSSFNRSCYTMKPSLSPSTRSPLSDLPLVTSLSSLGFSIILPFLYGSLPPAAIRTPMSHHHPELLSSLISSPTDLRSPFSLSPWLFPLSPPPPQSATVFPPSSPIRMTHSRHY